MSKHTQGLWKTDGNITTRKVDGYETTAVAVSRADVAQAVALVYAGFGDGPSNARLIAAAPELLAACKAVAGVFQDSDDMPLYARKCLAAIAKATGEQL